MQLFSYVVVSLPERWVSSSSSSTRLDSTRPDQTRPDQTRPDHTGTNDICSRKGGGGLQRTLMMHSKRAASHGRWVGEREREITFRGSAGPKLSFFVCEVISSRDAQVDWVVTGSADFVGHWVRAETVLLVHMVKKDCDEMARAMTKRGSQSWEGKAELDNNGDSNNHRDPTASC